jgi:hypothetical protein
MDEKFDICILENAISGEVTDNGVTVCNIKNPTTQLILYSKGSFLHNGSRVSYIKEYTDDNGVLELDFVAPGKVLTGETVEIKVRIDGRIANVLPIAIIPGDLDTKYFTPDTDKGNSIRRQKFTELTDSDTYIDIDISDEEVLSLSSLRIIAASDYMQLISEGFPSMPSIEPTEVDIQDITVLGDGSYRINLAESYTGEVFIEYLVLGDNPAFASSLLKY